MLFRSKAGGADGDVIDFAAALYGLGKKEAAVQLAQDFGLSYSTSGRPMLIMGSMARVIPGIRRIPFLF